jgi:hypothetical protein
MREVGSVSKKCVGCFSNVVAGKMSELKTRPVAHVISCLDNGSIDVNIPSMFDQYQRTSECSEGIYIDPASVSAYAIRYGIVTHIPKSRF